MGFFGQMLNVQIYFVMKEIGWKLLLIHDYCSLFICFGFMDASAAPAQRCLIKWYSLLIFHCGHYNFS